MHAKLPKAAPEAAQFFLRVFLHRGGWNDAEVATGELAPHVSFGKQTVSLLANHGGQKGGEDMPFHGTGREHLFRGNKVLYI